jgi:6-phosphogluconate dehydrogenase
MQLAMVGLGRMGMNMARRLLRGGHEVVAYNRTPARTDELAGEGAVPAYTLGELVAVLQPPRVVWLMLPAGEVIEQHLRSLMELLSPRDIVVDGGNSRYQDDARRATTLGSRDISYLDVGVSGGIWGLQKGYCTMVGGARETYQYLEPVLKTLAPVDGYLYCGPAGAGHFLKMVHNGIEYGLMQAYAEGFALLEGSDFAAGLDYRRVAHLWNRGSVIRSWLLELLEDAFAQDQKLTDLKGYVEDSGEGRWMIEEAVDKGVAVPVIAQALFQRFDSRQDNNFANRILAALRREFGGHAVFKGD